MFRNVNVLTVLTRINGDHNLTIVLMHIRLGRETVFSPENKIENN